MPGADQPEPIVVTGAAGYLGGRIVSALGEAARAVVRAPVAWLPERVQTRCDLLGPADDVARALSGASAVIHLAGHNEVVAAADPGRAGRETLAMAESVSRAARSCGIPRLVYVSTVHVYGTALQPGAEIDETVTPDPTSPYAQARLECEQLLDASDDLEVVVLRLTNAVGAPADPTVDRWTLVASDLGRQAVLDRTMVLRSDGLQWRDFIALDDASRLTVGALDPARVGPGTYNLGSGVPTTVRHLAEVVQQRVERTCGFRPELVAPEATRRPDAPYQVVVDKLGGCGLRAELSLEDGVDEIVDHCTKHEAALRQRGAQR